jgi:hypothetical protein
MRTTIVCSALAAILATSQRAPAAPSSAERAIAESLFKEGKALLAKGRVAEACSKLAASYRIEQAGGTLMNLAMCHERQGKTAAAWGEFNDALAMAKRTGNRIRQDEARTRIAALERRLAHLAVSAPSGAPPAGLEIRVDDVPIDAGGASALPVDPGPHVVSATAPGRRPWKTDVMATESTTTPVDVPQLDLEQRPADVETPAPPPSWPVPVGAAAVGAGALGLAVGAYFGARALNLGREVSAECPQMACSVEGASTLARGRTAAGAANGLLVAGGVLAAGGAVLLIVSRPSARAPAVGLSPAIAPGLAFVSANGSF